MEWGNFFIDLWKHHRGKTLGIILGLIFGLMVVILGFFEAVFIALCVVIGYFIGRRIDDNIGFRDLLDRIFNDH